MSTATRVNSRIQEYVGNNPSDQDYAAWLQKVDNHLSSRIGVGVLDLPDRCWRDDFEGGTTPQEAAAEALADEGYDLDEEGDGE